MIRAFLAVELPDDLRAQLAQLQDDIRRRLNRDLSRDVRISWVRPASIHLTMKFLGDIDEQLVEPMRGAIGRALGTLTPVAIPLERLGGFPQLNQPRVLWVGPSELWERGEDAKLAASLHRTIETCCCSLDLAPDGRAVSPHLTLARIREGGRQVGQALAKSGVLDRPMSLGSLVLDSIALIKSDLRPTGSVYTKLWAVQIGGR
jgi:2'-5' RNA ligase